MNRQLMIAALMQHWLKNADDDTQYYHKDSELNYYNALSDDELSIKYNNLVLEKEFDDDWGTDVDYFACDCCGALHSKDCHCDDVEF